MKLPINRRQAGDTIVEVLIAIGVVSLVLVGAFLVSNNSTKTVQDNQERTQAQQILQAQVEELKVIIDGGGDPITGGGANPYCKSKTDGSYIAAADMTQCLDVVVGGAPDGKITISRDGNNIYTFTITWSSIKGGQGWQSFVYRPYTPGPG